MVFATTLQILFTFIGNYNEMADNPVGPTRWLLFRGTGTGSPETFNVVACLINHNIAQGGNDITTETTCGEVSTPGTQTRSASFSCIPVLSPSSGKIGWVQLQEDYDDQSYHNWKITTSDGATGDPIYSFNAYLQEFNIDSSTTDNITANGTLKPKASTWVFDTVS